MTAILTTLKDKQGNTLYPLTKTNAVSDSNGTSLDSLLSGKVSASQLLNLVYPIGSIYIGNENSSSPASWLGGTWQQIKDKFLLASGNSYTAGAEGGSATHTLTLGNGYAQITYTWQDSQNRLGLNLKSVSEWTMTRNSNSSMAGFVNNAGKKAYDAAQLAGSTDSSSNMPPYKVVKVWQRTA